MSHDESILSVGVDVGTTTTHLLISRLVIGSGDDPFEKLHVLDRQIVHRGRIHRTPLKTETEVDDEQIERIVAAEYEAASVRANEIRTGAILITGEAANKSNAERVVRRLAPLAGRFASAAAGPNLESTLAARGNGSFDLSRRQRLTVLSIDVGGGTSNLAWIENGELRDAACLRVGARHMIRNGRGSWRANGDLVASLLGARETSDPRDLVRLFGDTLECTLRGWSTPAAPLIVTEPQGSLPTPDAVVVSGGVGELMNRVVTGRPFDGDIDDLGSLLADELLRRFQAADARLEFHAEPIRATVIGAGMFSTQISGQTLWADSDVLPIADVPVIRPFRRLDEMKDPVRIAKAILQSCRLIDLDWTRQPLAVALPSLRVADYARIVELGVSLAEAAASVRAAFPWTFLMKDNFGRLLGESMSRSNQEASILVIDEIDFSGADYIDVGEPLTGDPVVLPVVVKNLVFGR
jgi:ethanolamine utilization protein EutA